MKNTIFNSDECQALLDLIDKVGDNTPWPLLTDEEHVVYNKLKKAGAFYVPKKQL